MLYKEQKPKTRFAGAQLPQLVPYLIGLYTIGSLHSEVILLMMQHTFLSQAGLVLAMKNSIVCGILFIGVCTENHGHTQICCSL